MAKLQSFTEDQLKDLKIKQLYMYRTKWYDKHVKDPSNERAWNEFLKAKKLIKEIEKWQDESSQWWWLRLDLHSYNDFLQIKDNPKSSFPVLKEELFD
jgi:ABC-type glycerol-3-phosphate transport system substrate-binding protein